jgi:GalNAc-alpha-(1->4)-GalNAc-alpha-(1->3)-diNAcBac-PP-undecaprenol alpha-1,4-N-acetyl-D-galactosaminyltransferase
MHLVFVIASLNFGGAERALSELANHYVDAQIRLIQLNQSSSERLFHFKRLKAILSRVFCLRRTLKKLYPTVIISFIDIINLTTLLAAWKLKIPIIVSERTHPTYYHIPLIYQKLRSLLYPKASHVVVQTQSAADYFDMLKYISVIPNWVKKVAVAKKSEDCKTVQSIVSIGRLIPSKAFDTLIYAFKN